ncbi:hypothetical protein [Rosenbergiella epipactidis]|uniref:hypothetical protein n=1 Tax=Rosenbergiella epipactidis TaxID=1544694 RepID=UPI001F4F4530|nr:hypothetical protein [Rosenbergiella epipactidis]
MKKIVLPILLAIIYKCAIAGEDKPISEKSCIIIKSLDVGSRGRVYFKGSILRFQQQCWFLPLKAGNKLHIELSDSDGNSALSLYKPGAKVSYGSGDLSLFSENDDGSYRNPANTYTGETIDGASDYDNARKVDTNINASGNYLMVIGLSRGPGSDFQGFVEIE